MINKNKIEISLPIKHHLLLDKKHFYDLCRILISKNDKEYELSITVEDAETDTDFDRIISFFEKDEVLHSSKNTFRITTIFGYVYIVIK